MRLLTTALLALGITLVFAAPNNQVVIKNETNSTKVEVVKENTEKGDSDKDIFSGLAMSDASYVTACIKNTHCRVMNLAQARGLQYDTLASVRALKGQTGVSNALAPSLTTMTASLRNLQTQNEQLKNLEAAMASLTAASTKGQTLNEAVKDRFAETMSKAAVYSAPPASYKGLALAPPSKGAAYAAPPSKGAGAYSSTMQYEAVMCPMTVYELGKTQKLGNEMKFQLESSNVVNAQLMAEKARLESALATMEVLKIKAEQQADFNAKYAAEQKSQAEMLSSALTISNTEKNMVISQKTQLEIQLSTTQRLLSMEKAENTALTQDLAACNDVKNSLTIQLAVQTKRAEDAEQELAETKAALEEETQNRISCDETLEFTQNRLAKTEDSLNKEREVREQTEEELMRTMVSLSSCQKEARVLTEILGRTQDELQEKTAALAREEEAHRAVQANLDETTEELRATQQELRDTKRELEDEQNAHATTQRVLDATQAQLEATEAARQALEEAKSELEDELAETKAQLEMMTAERDQLQITLDATSAALAETTALKMQCESSLATQIAVSEQLSSQLTDTMTLLKLERDAREELAATIALVQETSMKVQEEVKKLQDENALLQAQVEKLRDDQEVAMAMAAGCPPTYEKFGSSCYKYVREKTPWKNAQEQCMKDSGNLVAVESTQEQIFLTNYLKRHGASDAYSYTGGIKYGDIWKWLDHESAIVQPQFWYNEATQTKANYNCQAMYVHDPYKYGQWVSLPCYSSAPYVCEYQLLPVPASVQVVAEQIAILNMADDAPGYLKDLVR